MDIDKIVDLKNALPIDDFSGLSSEQMHQLLYVSKDNEVLKITKSTEANHEVPILKLIGSLINKIDSEKGMKLTPSGNLPVKIVKELYLEKIMLDKHIEAGITKLSKEFDSESIHYARIIGTLAGYFRKANNKILVTKAGKQFHKKNDNLGKVLNTFGTKFNLGYLDGYENDTIAQLGFRFSIFLIKKYGNIERELSFYAEKYFIAFPSIAEGNDRDISCYSVRTFERFLRYFGFIELKGNWRNEKVQKTKLLDKYVQFNV